MSAGTGADDLDDGLDYVIDSEEEVSAVVIREEESEDEKKVMPETKKRKKTDDKLKEKKRAKMQQDLQKKKELSLKSSTDLAYEFTQILVKHQKDSTQLDHFKKADFVDGSSYKNPRILDNFKDFTDKYNKGLTIILAISRVRIGDLYKALGLKSKAIKIGKGYNSKIRDDTKYVIGTVERINNISFEGHEIKSIILDACYQNQKTHSIIDEPKLTPLLKKFKGTKIILF